MNLPIMGDLTCPMCDAPIVAFDYQSNARRVESSRGLVGFIDGDPGAQFECANSCEFKTSNRQALERFLAKMKAAKEAGSR